MPQIHLSPPLWQAGELLSAGKLNQLSSDANAIKGAAIAPGATFVRNGNDSVWHFRRRRWRYLHVSFTTAGVSCMTRIQINATTVYNNGTLYPSGTTQVFDLDAVGGVAVGAAYSVSVSYTASSATHETTGIVEHAASSRTGLGSYSTPASWSGSETAAQFLSDLQSLSSTVTSLAQVVITPSATWLRPTESTVFERRRKLRYLVVNLTVGSTPNVDIFVNSTTVVNDATTGTHVIDLSSVSGGPSVRDYYRLEIRRTTGTMLVNTIEEAGDVWSTAAPAWSHGELINAGAATKLGYYTTLLNESYAILGAAGWQMPQIWRPYEHPRWGLHKTKRYLHYMRNGSLPASLQDPASVQPDISLSSTTTEEPWSTYDLDTIDWLAPGGLLYVYECDCVWLDDTP